MKHLAGHGQRNPADLMRQAADWCEANDVDFDGYGTGKALTDFEEKIASLLGFEAARFMPSGTMAQNIAMRVWCDKHHTPVFGMHPTCHLELHEHRAYSHLHGLRATLVGSRHKPMLAGDLAKLEDHLAALIVELPIREAGGQLPSWEQLQALKKLAADRGIALHLDGARLWQCPAYYGRSFAQICEGFQSAYVSFYKDVGGWSGAMLLGDKAFINQSKIWQRRQGGNLWSLLPNLASAAARLDATIALGPALHAHAKKLAAAIAKVPGVRIQPPIPHTSMFHIIADGDIAQAKARGAAVAKDKGIQAFRGLREGSMPGTFRTEISLGRPALELTEEEAFDAWNAIVNGEGI